MRSRTVGSMPRLRSRWARVIPTIPPPTITIFMAGDYRGVGAPSPGAGPASAGPGAPRAPERGDLAGEGRGQRDRRDDGAQRAAPVRGHGVALPRLLTAQLLYDPHAEP